LFVIAFLLLHIRQRQTRTLLANLAWLAGGVGALFLPWFIHVLDGKLDDIFAYYLTTASSAAPAWVQEFNGIGDISSYLPIPLWLLLFLCAGWGLWRREKGVALVSLWWMLNLLAANPQWLRLPGEGIVNNFAVFIAAYIPASVLIGSGFGWWVTQWHVASNTPVVSQSPDPDRSEEEGTAEGQIEGWLMPGSVAQRGKWAISLLLLLLVTGVGMWGVRERLGDLHVPQHALVARPDLRAAAWIRENTLQDARFLVNSFFAYGGSLIVGSDGGWWLPLMTQRQITLPPITYGSEQGPQSNYIHWVIALTAEIQNKGITSPDVLALLRERGVTHVYVGQRQGRVNYDGPHVLEPAKLLSDLHFRPVYHQDRVWIFEVLP
jgi:hypothetical protein